MPAGSNAPAVAASGRDELTVISPVPMVEIVDLWARNVPRIPKNARAIILQAARSESIGWVRHGRLEAAALLYPVDGTAAELVFACREQMPVQGAGMARSAVARDTGR